MPTQTTPTLAQLATNAQNIADSVISRIVNTQADEKLLIHDLAVAIAILAQAVQAVTPASFSYEPGTNAPAPTKAYAQKTK